MGRRFSDEDFKKALALIPDPAQQEFLREGDDPVHWSEKYFFDPDEGEVPFRVKPMFRDLLRCSKKNRAVRVGRQSGKTVHLSIDLAHTASCNKNRIILVFIPETKQMNRILEIMANLMRKSPLKDSFSMQRRDRRNKKKGVDAQYDHEIRVSNGSVIRFFFMQNNPNKARGQRGTDIYIDEAEYLPAKAYDVILGVIKGNPNANLWASSTPSGIEGTWFREFCTEAARGLNPNSIEFHLPTTLEENWPEIRARLKEIIFDEVTWQLEVLAEWAEAKGAVYRKQAIDDALLRSVLNGVPLPMEQLRDLPEYASARKALGVDWNTPQNGVRLVEVSHLLGMPRITRHEIISYENYTQLSAVNRVIELQRQLGYAVISVDEGYGATQYELLLKEFASAGINAVKILQAVDANKREKMFIEISNPATGQRRRREITVRIKDRMAGLLGKYLEERLSLPQEEDVERSGLVKEIRNFRRKETLTGGIGFLYTEQCHSLMALQMCILGYDRVIGPNPGEITEEAVLAIASSVLDKVLVGDPVAKKGKGRPQSAIIRSGLGRQIEHSRTEGLRGYQRHTL